MVSFVNKTKDQVTLNKSIYLAQIIWDSGGDIIYNNGKFWQWGGQIYNKIDDIDWMIEMTRRFPALDESTPRQQNEIREVYKRFSKVSSEEFNKDDGLCFLNKYLDLKTLKALDHDYRRINTVLLPYDYDDKAACPLWLKTTDEIFEGNINNKKILQEFFGYCLTKYTRHMKALFMIGEGNTGKSTVLEALNMIVGDENTSFLSPRYYKDSFRLAEIENKLVLMCHEIPKRVEDYESEFRQIVSGQTLDVNGKYIKPFKIKPFCKVVWAMNELPRIDDHSSAFFNRVLPVEFNRIFQEHEQDKDLPYKLKAELPGILNWAVEGLKSLRERGVFLKDAYMKAHIEEMRLANNPIATWAKENIVVKKGDELIKADVYQKYHLWCGTNGHKPTSSSKFAADFFKIFRKSTNKFSRQTTGYERKYVWPNLAWLSSQIEAQEEWAE